MAAGKLIPVDQGICYANQLAVSENHVDKRLHLYAAGIAVLAMLAVAVSGYLGLPRAELPQPLVADCLLDRQGCSAPLPGGGRVDVDIAPRPVPTSRPLRVTVQLDSLQAERVAADFQGVEMNMGLHSLTLQALGDGRYAGETTLPVCVTGKMIWQMTLRLRAGRSDISVPFRFESGHGP